MKAMTLKMTKKKKNTWGGEKREINAKPKVAQNKVTNLGVSDALQETAFKNWLLG